MRWKLAAAAGWTLLIIGLCSIPGGALPEAPIVSADKLVHFGLFLIFAWLWLEVTDNRGKTALRNVLIAGLLLAGLTEVYQGFLPFRRQPDVYDALANSIGLLVGVGSQRMWKRRKSS